MGINSYMHLSLFVCLSLVKIGFGARCMGRDKWEGSWKRVIVREMY